MNSIAVILLTLMMKSKANTPPGNRPGARLIQREMKQRGGLRTQLPKLISKGGFGRVYQVETVNGDGALKVFDMGKPRQDIKDCEYERAMLELIAWCETNELERVMQISHVRTDYPAVPRQLMLEYIDGKDLTKADFADSSMPELVNVIYSMMQQIRDNVLKDLHSVKIYHNDIKPANILFVPGTESSVDPMFYLIDFGLAVDGSNSKVAPAQLQDQWTWCTLKFVSPYLFEIRGETRMPEEKIFEAAEKADYYSLALTAIVRIRNRCLVESKESKDPLCKMAHDLLTMQTGWGEHAQKFVKWSLTDIENLLVPFWTKVDLRISNFRFEHPTEYAEYPEFINLLAKWVSWEDKRAE